METTAIYPGTFDPITNGHADLIQRASSIFPRVIVLVSADTRKTPLFDLDERVGMVKEAVADCGLVDAIKELKGRIIIRGLRAVSDFEYESQMALMNRRLNPAIETFFMISSEEYAYISSSFVKEISSLGGDIHTMVPPVVAARLVALHR